MNRYKQILLILVAASITACGSTQIVHVPSYFGPQPIEQGSGVAVLPDSSRYEGEFQNGLFHGKGKLSGSNGNRYEGEFDQGLLSGQGTADSSNGDRYVGGFVDGMRSGQGKLTRENGEWYEGAFEKDTFHGQGVFTYASGDQYRGEFVDGVFSGKGHITFANGNSYEGGVANWLFEDEGVFHYTSGKQYSGQFKTGVPNGQGVIEYSNGDRYEGGVNGWNQFHGEGLYTMASGDEYQGQFENGVTSGVILVRKKSGEESYQGELKDWTYSGSGELTSEDGRHYKGEFEYGVYNGQGTLTIPGSGTYTGAFLYGSYHGEGELEYTDKKNEKKRVAGQWARGKYVGDNAHAYVADGITRLNSEKILFEQPQKVAHAIQQLLPQLPGKTDLYFIGFGSDGSQNVFMNEVTHSAGVMDELYGTGERTVELINNLQTLEQLPLATATNLAVVLDGVASKMDLEEDILFLYLTSHGSKEHKLSVEMEEMPLEEIGAVQLKKIIDEAGIKWKVILVSACYSGGFVEVLKDDHSLIITSARADRTSFGCGNDSELTYFGQAFFKESLNDNASFIHAFHAAKESVTKRELEEGFEPSMPQINYGLKIEAKLKQLERKLHR
ncbi:MAG: caspase family protein [Gammaproteobacteria bacterium]|nr:caspase family protein [Gammaproteobacteria bacterium]